MIEAIIPLRSHDEAILVLGPYDRHAKLLRQIFDLEITTRSGNLRLKGAEGDVGEVKRRIEHLLGKSRKGRELESKEIEAILIGQSLAAPAPAPTASSEKPTNGSSSTTHAAQFARRVAPGDGAAIVPMTLRVHPVEPRSANQRAYLDAIERNPLVFGAGVAGTGKTFLAVAAAVRALRAGECKRLVISRPVVEAGERLGFLPGDLQAKLNPYMRPIYDALADILRFEDVIRLEEQGVIEIAPLAYMRGRTLSHAFVILDEAQNTSVAQMKMFLTRLGERSRMVVTGDPSQIDLDKGVRSGFADAIRRLRGFQGIGCVEFDARDIVRHPLVEQIVRAYELPGRGDEGEGLPFSA
ncbi:MAG: PhoH family protein [Planctomycetes bacterium]|nr:PhoH family protein [Planctomycetota bacterium]